MLSCVKTKFLTRLLNMATTIDALLELLLANSQELFGDVVVNSSTVKLQ